MAAQGVAGGAPLQVLRGLSSQVELYADQVVIRRIGLVEQLLSGDRIIRLDEIEAVRLFESRFFTYGCLQFVLTQGEPHAVGINFRGRDLAQALAIKETVEDCISRRAAAPHLRTLQP